MDKPPVSYLQTDPRWASVPYAAAGERTTIGGSGCGPTAMAMVLATWADPRVTPETECAWALAHGYKAKGQGTYYSYFVPAARRYGLACRRLNSASIYGNADSSCHKTAQDALARGDLVIACMGPGTWTRSGHYVLAWLIAVYTVCVNDPSGTRPARTRGSWAAFRREVKYYWVLERPETRREEEADMTEEDVKAVLEGLSDEAAYRLLEKALRHAGTLPEQDWSRREGHWARAKERGIFDGTRPGSPITRAETAAVLGRLGAFP